MTKKHICHLQIWTRHLLALLIAGIREPIKLGVESGVRLGVGKQEEDNLYTDANLIERRRLESEIQATEDEDRRRKREVSCLECMTFLRINETATVPRGR